VALRFEDVEMTIWKSVGEIGADLNRDCYVVSTLHDFDWADDLRKEISKIRLINAPENRQRHVNSKLQQAPRKLRKARAI
jgi:hypothetical protein